MIAVYVTSTERGAGKTAVAAALGKHLQDNRKKVGYLRLAAQTAPDASIMKQALGLKEDNPSADAKGFSAAYEKASQGKDIVIIEWEGVSLLPDALTVQVMTYSPAPGAIPPAKNLLGVVVNRVPASRVHSVRKDLLSKGVKLLGVIAEDRALASPTVQEMAQTVGGEVMGSGNTSELVESVMIGAMGLGSGIPYFSLKSNKAVVTRVDRPDQQMAALETSTRCLIITSDKAPAPVVASRAKQKKVPIVMVKEDIKATLERIEGALDSAPFSARKLARLMQIPGVFDFAAVNQAIGIAAK